MVLGLTKRAIIIGGGGVLGRSLVMAFKTSWEVTSIDLVNNPEAQKSLILTPDETQTTQAATVLKALEGKYNAIMCVAGGFVAGGPGSEEVFSQCENMMRMNLFPSLLAANLATKFLHDYGMLLFTGAAVPFKGTAPGLLAYTLSKTAVHSLALNMSARTELPSIASVVTILPETIDTPSNRKSMPDADKSKWLDPMGIAALLKMWAEGSNRPENGSFAVLKKEGGSVVPEFV